MLDSPTHFLANVSSAILRITIEVMKLGNRDETGTQENIAAHYPKSIIYRT